MKTLHTAALAALLTLAPAANAGPFQELTAEQLFEYIWQDFSFFIPPQPHPAVGRKIVCFSKDSDRADMYCPITQPETELMEKYYAENPQPVEPEPDEDTGI